MNKRTVMASLNKIANELDNNGLHNEADTVTKVMSRLAYDFEGMGEEEINGNDEYNVEDYMPYGDEDDDMDMEDEEMMDDEDFPVEYDEMMAEFSKTPKSGPYSGLADREEYMHGDDMKGYMDTDSDF